MLIIFFSFEIPIFSIFGENVRSGTGRVTTMLFIIYLLFLYSWKTSGILFILFYQSTNHQQLNVLATSTHTKQPTNQLK